MRLLDVHGQAGRNILDVDGQVVEGGGGGRGEGARKLDNFDGRHICIVP